MPSPLSLVLVGDILTGRGVAPALRSPQNTLWRYQGIIAGAELAFGNLEQAARSPRTGRKPFYNVGDLEVLCDVGFDAFSLANNHTLDAGDKSALQTWEALKRLDMSGSGLTAGNPSDSPTPEWEVKEVGQAYGYHVALVSVTQWGPLHSGDASLASLDLAYLKSGIRQLSERYALPIVSLHWGTEGVTSPSPTQRQIARELIDAGAVVVWGHHPHVAGPVETYKGRPIFYSTGNFLWDAMPTPQSGLLARVQITGTVPATAKVTWKTWRVQPQAKVLKAPPTPKGETRIQALAGNFGDGANSWILWTKKRDGRPILRALEKTERGWRVRATGFPREVRRIQTGDVNGDGRDELVVELRQRSKLDVGIKPRLHVYGVGAHSFTPLWRGSLLSRPFFEWTLTPRSDATDSDVAALERGLKGTQWLTVYRWNGFGLRVVWQHQFEGALRNLKSGCDKSGPYLSCDLTQKNGVRHLQARRLLGEDWQIEQNNLSHSSPLSGTRP